MKRAVIQGIGHAVPDKVLTNADLEKLVETNDAWIRQRTGIAERRVCGPNDTTTSLSLLAGQRALAAAGLDPTDLDLVVVGTVSSDYPFPSTACLVQDAIGAHSRDELGISHIVTARPLQAAWSSAASFALGALEGWHPLTLNRPS